MNDSSFSIPTGDCKSCLICLDCHSANDGMTCSSGHFLCGSDLNSYLAENVFPAVFKMRETRCAIPCPAENCRSKFNPLHVYHRMTHRERARYKSIMDDVTSNIPSLQMLRSALLDVMTLKCPSCSVPVDPFPDACSAVMCLNCGNHYCNFCFMPFATGVMAHEHVASHSTSEKPENRDAFLSAELVAGGQKLHQILQLEKCISLALSSPEYGVDEGHEVAIALIMCHSEVSDLNIDILKLWQTAQNTAMTGYASRPSKTPTNRHRRSGRSFIESDVRIRSVGSSFLVSTSSDDFDSTDDTEIDTASSFSELFGPTMVDDQHPYVPKNPALPSTVGINGDHDDALRARPVTIGMALARARDVVLRPEMIQRQGAVQLANALITYNTEAAAQIMATYPDGNLDVDYTDVKHGYPLCSLALITGQADIALKLLELGANPLKPNASGRTVMYVAAEAGLENVIRCIVHLHPELDLNAPITSELQRYSPIHVAARYNHGHLIRYLASLGADLNQEESEHSYSPLTLSLVLGHCWAASELMHAGAAVRVITTNGRTPMFVAAEKGLGEMIRIMIEDCNIDVNEPVVLPSGLRLIHVAAFHRQAHTVAQLVALGADVNIVDDEGGYNPLTMAIIGGNISSALTIIKAGADVRAQSQSGRLPMYIAVEKGLTEVVRTLIMECGIGVNERTTSEISAVTPLHVAVLHGQSHLIPMLISLGADVNLLDQEKHCCPLIAAIILQDEWSVQLLIEANANANRLSREGRGPMYIAAEKDSASILRMLVEKCGIDVNAPATNEVDKGSPLHVAAMFDNASSVSVLLQMGADVHIKDALGRTAEEISRNAFSRKAYDVLKNHVRMLELESANAIKNAAIQETAELECFDDSDDSYDITDSCDGSTIQSQSPTGTDDMTLGEEGEGSEGNIEDFEAVGEDVEADGVEDVDQEGYEGSALDSSADETPTAHTCSFLRGTPPKKSLRHFCTCFASPTSVCSFIRK